MLFQEEDIQLLTQIGFTEAQAKLYLSLLGIGQTDVKNLAKQADVPRQAAYRTLGELQEKGLVERIIALPQEYKAIPIHDGLAIMISTKANEYARLLTDAKEFMLRFENKNQQAANQHEYSINIVEGKDTVIKKSINSTDHADTEICIFSTFQRWTHVKMEICETVERALKRGVKYRVIIENCAGDFCFSKEFKSVLTHPNYETRLTSEKLKINACLFDDKEACFSLYPSKNLAETPMIWTNHPSLIIGFRDHFENVWGSSEEIDLKVKIK
jgi:sugar-specific transcriptional regulator TrmB